MSVTVVILNVLYVTSAVKSGRVRLTGVVGVAAVDMVRGRVEDTPVTIIQVLRQTEVRGGAVDRRAERLSPEDVERPGAGAPNATVVPRAAVADAARVVPCGNYLYYFIFNYILLPLHD